uniref:Genome polyprotein n=1 Tax=Guangdong red-banded snake picornavirus TaxID=2116181 RepID=A0A2P1GN73_9VIRU|nr:polyprotein [Guangdong red-banded snake picornavirus]
MNMIKSEQDAVACDETSNREVALVASSLGPSSTSAAATSRNIEQFALRSIRLLSGVASNAFGSPLLSFGGLFGPQLMSQISSAIADSFSAHNTSFSDQAAEPVQVSSSPFVSSPLNPSNLEVPFQAPTISDRFYPIVNFDWKVVSTDSQWLTPRLLVELDVPGCFYTKLGNQNYKFAVANMLAVHRFVRSDFEFLIQANAPPFYQGALIAVFCPVFHDQLGFTLSNGKRSAIIGKPVRSFSTVANYAHGIINLYSNSSVRVQVPFSYFENSFDQLMKAGKIGTLQVYVLNKLDAYSVSSSTSVPVTISARFVNLQMTGLMPFNSRLLSDASKVSYRRHLYQQGAKVVIEPGPSSQFLANKFETVGAQRLALSDSDAAIDITSFGYIPTMDLLEFCRIPSVLVCVPWRTNHQSGKVLWSVPVTPSIPMYQGAGSVMGVKGLVNWQKLLTMDTNLSYWSSLYGAWRGSLSYHFQTVMSSFHRGRLQVIFVPGDVSPRPDNSPFENARYAVFDIGPQTTFTFTVPFMDARPYVPCHQNLDGDDNPSPDLWETGFETKYFSTGYLYLRVWTELTAPVTVSSQIEVNVWISAGSDFQFLFPVLSDELAPLPSKVPQQVEQQAGEIEATDIVPDQVQCDVIQKVDVVFSYVHTDVSLMLGRAHYYGRFKDVHSFAFKLIPPYQGALGFMFGPHTFLRGPLTLHLSGFVSSGLSRTWNVTVIPPGMNYVNHPDHVLSSGAVVWDLQAAATLNVKVPFYNQYNAVLTEAYYRFDSSKRLVDNHFVIEPSSPVYFGTLILDPISPVFDDTDVKISLQVAMSFDESFVMATKRAVPATVKMAPSNAVIIRAQDDELLSDWDVLMCHDSPLEEIHIQGDVLSEGDVVTNGRRYGIVVKCRGVLRVFCVVHGIVGPVDSDDWTVVNSCDVCDFPYDPKYISMHVLALENCRVNGSDAVFANMMRNGSSHDHASVMEKVFKLLSVQLQGQDDDESFLSSVLSAPRRLKVLSESVSRIREYLPDMDGGVFSNADAFAVQRAMAFVVKVGSYVGLLVSSSDKPAALCSILLMIGSDVMMFAPKACSWVVSRIERFVCHLSSLLPFRKDLEAHEQGELCDGVESLAADVTSAMLGLETPVTLKSWMSGCRIVSTVAAGAKGLYWLLSFFITSLKNAFNYFSQRDYSERLVCMREHIVQHLAAVNAMSMVPQSEWVKNKKEIVELHGRGLVYQVDIADMHVDSGDFVPLRWALAKTDEMYNYVLEADDIYTRVEPAVIVISGAPGVGKSVVARSFAADLCVRAGLDPHTNVYSKTYGRGDEFWDGYHGQYVQIIDDMGNDPEDKDFTGFLQLVSSAVYRCNMARLHEKGRLYTTPVIIVTTNFGSKFESSCSVETVRSSAAIYRRVSMHICMVADGPAGVCLSPKDFIDPVLSKVVFRCHKKTVLYPDLLDKIHSVVSEKLCTFQEMVRARTDYQTSHVKKDVDMPQYKPPNDLLDTPIFQALKSRSEGSQVSENPVIHSLRAFVNRCIAAAKNWWSPIARLMVTLFGIAGLGYGLYQYFSSLREDKEKVEEQVAVYQPQVPAKAPRKPVPVVPEFKIHTQGLEDVITKIGGNVCKVVSSGLSKGLFKTMTMNALMIGGDKLVYPRHLVEHYDDKVTIKVVKDDYSFEFERMSCDTSGCVDIGGLPADMIVETLASQSRHFPSLTKLMLPSCQFERLGIGSIGTLLVRKEQQIFALQARNFWFYGSLRIGEKIISSYVLGYMTVTVVGHCGAPVLVKMPEGYRIVGIHVAGDGATKGYCVPLVREMFEPVGLQGLPHVINVGKLHGRIFMPTVTRYRSTVFQNALPVTKQPSVKSIHDSRCKCDLVDAVFSKYKRRESIVMVSEARSVVMEYMWSLMARYIGKYSRVSYLYAVEGMQPYVQAMDRSTSAGYPWLEKYTNKGQFLDSVGESAVVDLENMYKKGEPADVLFVTYLKDELRPLDKIASGKSRIIEAAPAHYVALFRQVTMQFVWSFHAAHSTGLHSAVGCDPDVFWTMLYFSLKQRKYGLDLDYSKFDASVSQELLIMVREILCWFTDDENALLLRWLWEPILSARYVYIDDVYEATGLPSGMPCTTVVNTLVNIMLIVYAWIETGHDISDMDSKLEFCCYGDDVILSTDVDDFGFSEVVAPLEKLGFDVTRADKQSDGQYTSVDDLTFLRRGFRVDDEHYAVHPVIDLETVNSMLCWKSVDAILQDNVDAALWFVYHHGKRVYDEYVEMIRKVCLDEGISVFIRPYCVMQRDWYIKMGLPVT